MRQFFKHVPFFVKGFLQAGKPEYFAVPVLSVVHAKLLNSLPIKDIAGSVIPILV